MLLDRAPQILLLDHQVRTVFLSLNGKHLGYAFPGPDASHEGLELDEADKAAVQLGRVLVVLLVRVLTRPVLLHQARLLLQLVLLRARPHLFLGQFDRIATLAVGAMPDRLVQLVVLCR